MKTFIFTLLAGLVMSQSMQGQIFNEQFNGSLPPWPQSPAGSWSLSPTLGVGGSGCVFTEDLSVGATVTITSPTLNLSAISNPTISFKAAFVQNNFLIPNLALFYDAGAGPQFMARWGTGFSPNTTYTVSGDADYVSPLDAEYVQWQNCSYTLATSATNTALSFVFQAELYNGGYLLLDSVVVTGLTSTISVGLAEQHGAESLDIFPNPAQHSILIKAAGLKQLLITNALGQTLPLAYTAFDHHMVKAELTALAPGLYVLSALMENNAVLTKKIVLEKKE